MHEPFLNSGWDMFLLAGSLISLLFLSLFRLDALLAAPKRHAYRFPSAGIDEDGRRFLSDPDGRPWYLPDNSR